MRSEPFLLSLLFFPISKKNVVHTQISCININSIFVAGQLIQLSKMIDSEKKLYKQAYWLSLFTIFYNIIEGVVSMALGYEDETLSLFGFGADSFIEVMSGIGIAIMIMRIRQNPNSHKSKFEVTSLKITGTAFYFLAAGLFTGIVLNLIQYPSVHIPMEFIQSLDI